MLIDSNLIIYATQPQYHLLRTWLMAHITHYSVISRLETLGYHRLDNVEKQAISGILDNLNMLMLNKPTLEIAIALRQQRKMSLGDVLIAATCLEHQLPLATANKKDFVWIDGLTLNNPLEEIP